ncbi:MAG: MBL fold metallo-hydrolase [Bacteroidetes bacterium]|jgi:glyoxylase-like metal-dependent hydrolase (beta-lactamase superfamily II)|nr:MBL fold metallo-hydrolase [Bacteroidota bacterium]
MQIQKFTFNPFDENTYVVYDNTNECIIIDPGCYMPEEKEALLSFIKDQQLKPVMLVNTHCHVDHIFGNKLIYDTFGLKPVFHRNELVLLEAAGEYSKQWGIFPEPSPTAEKYIDEGDIISFGNTSFELLFTPGHSPGSLCLYHAAEKIIISGDVLFQMSIGRYDLPGGNEQTLLESIRTKLLVLPADVKVMPGHGPTTTIGFEKMYNPFLV